MPFSETPVRRWTTRVVALKSACLRVLIVDDNVNAADAFAAYIGLFGVDSRPAYGGAGALKLALEWLPDIVLLDISMPQLDGFAVVRRLRAEPLLREVIVVALTAHDEAFVTQRAMPNEFDAYCQKGNPATALTALLSQLTSGAISI